MSEAQTTMGRPRKGIKVPERRSVKIDAALCGRAEMIAKSQGLAISQYLDAALAPVIARDFAKLVREMDAKPGE